MRACLANYNCSVLGVKGGYEKNTQVPKVLRTPSHIRLFKNFEDFYQILIGLYKPTLEIIYRPLSYRYESVHLLV